MEKVEFLSLSLHVVRSLLFMETLTFYSHRNPKEVEKKRLFNHDTPSMSLYAEKNSCEIDFEVVNETDEDGKNINFVKCKIRLMDQGWIFLNVIVLIIFPFISQLGNSEIPILRKLDSLEIYFLNLIIATLLFYIAKLHFEINSTKVKDYVESSL
jgi:hypothetical protein